PEARRSFPSVFRPLRRTFHLQNDQAANLDPGRSKSGNSHHHLYPALSRQHESVSGQYSLQRRLLQSPSIRRHTAATKSQGEEKRNARPTGWARQLNSDLSCLVWGRPPRLSSLAQRGNAPSPPRWSTTLDVNSPHARIHL